MGAPGYTVLCPEGHLIGIINSDLYWGETEDDYSVWKQLKRLENSKCDRCGKLAMYEFCHYDYDIVNDCLHFKIRYNIDEHRYIIPKDPKIGYRFLTKEEVKELSGCVIKR